MKSSSKTKLSFDQMMLLATLKPYAYVFAADPGRYPDLVYHPASLQPWIIDPGNHTTTMSCSTTDQARAYWETLPDE